MRLACLLHMERTTIDAWIVRYPDFPVVARGGGVNVAWQFDVEAVRNFIAKKRKQRDAALTARHAAIEAIRGRYSPVG